MPDPTDRAALVATIRNALAKATPGPWKEKYGCFMAGGAGRPSVIAESACDATAGDRELIVRATEWLAQAADLLAADAAEIDRLREEVAEERTAYMLLATRIIRATGIDVPVGGITAPDAVAALAAERGRLREAVQYTLEVRGTNGLACQSPVCAAGETDEFCAYHRLQDALSPPGGGNAP